MLIYNPAGRAPSSQEAGDNNKPSSLGSSYAAVGAGDELQSVEPQPYTPNEQTPTGDEPNNSELYEVLHRQALRVVDAPASVLAFSTPSGHVHMLKHLAPDVVYVVDSLAGERGSSVAAVRGWVGQVVVVVGGDGSGLGGLIDTEDEGEGGAAAAANNGRDRWWEHSDMVGLGKGVEVVDGVRFHEDWERRIGGRD